MGNTLVVYFSATGKTKHLAETIARVTEGDLFEIVPEEAYTAEDLVKSDENTRCFLESQDPNSRPKIKHKLPNIKKYSTIFIGFPVWWKTCPRILQTFVEENNFDKKMLVPFATSGGSGLGRGQTAMKESCTSNPTWRPGKRMKSLTGKKRVKRWIDSLNLK